MAKETARELQISRRIAELTEKIQPLEAQLKPLNDELSKLKNHLARIRNQRKRKSNAERDQNIRLAYEYLTGERVSQAGQQACAALGVKHPQIYQESRSARKALAKVLGLTRDRIGQILKEKPRKARNHMRVNEHPVR